MLLHLQLIRNMTKRKIYTGKITLFPIRKNFRDLSNAIQTGQIPGLSLYRDTDRPTGSIHKAESIQYFSPQSSAERDANQALLNKGHWNDTILHSQWNYNKTWLQLPCLRGMALQWVIEEHAGTPDARAEYFPQC